jgi:hypothetical protein
MIESRTEHTLRLRDRLPDERRIRREREAFREGGTIMHGSNCGRTLGITGVVAGLAVVGAVAVSSARVRVNTDLTATSAAPGARGKAKLKLKSDANGKFSVLARHLDPNASFSVVVKGVKVGTFHTSGGGNAKVHFRSHPKGTEQLLGFDPRGSDVVVRSEDGEDDLVGNIPDDQDSASAACCLQGHERDDDNEAECEDLSAAECTAHGGTPAAATSCLPNPCQPTPPGGGEVVCCLPGSAEGSHLDEGAEVECEDLTVDHCVAEGGTVVAATSCDPDPCNATPPASKVACCVPDDEGSECELVTPERCAAEHGTAVDSCDPNPGESSH